jgi:hypothetical protein
MNTNGVSMERVVQKSREVLVFGQVTTVNYHETIQHRRLQHRKIAACGF